MNVATAGAHVTIPIQVEIDDNPATGASKGTFIAPWPKVVVKRGDLVRWQIAKGQTFILKFTPCDEASARSPFKRVRVTDGDEFLQVVNPGHFHYRVSVTHASGEKCHIQHCPEFEVGD